MFTFLKNIEFFRLIEVSTDKERKTSATMHFWIHLLKPFPCELSDKAHSLEESNRYLCLFIVHAFHFRFSQ